MDLELRHLRAVCAIADSGSLTKAAVALGLSQPALTAQLKRVEREVGGPLFSRDHRGAVPTLLGEFVLSRARSILLSMAELRRGAQLHPGSSGRVIRLGGAMASVSVGQAYRLGKHLPGIDLHLRMEYSPQLLWELINAGRLDAIATVDYPGYELQSTSDIVCKVMTVEPVFVTLAADHKLADQDEIHLSELADERWALTPPDGAGWPGCFLAACEQAGFSAHVPYTISHGAQVRDLAINNRAVSPCQAVFEPGEGLVVRPLAGMPVVMRHVMACRRTGPLADHLAALVQFGREAHDEYALRAPHFLEWKQRHP